MTEKESKVWGLVSEFHRKMDLLDKGYAEASCKVDSHKTFEEIQTAFGMKSRDGYTLEVKALITKYGAKKLSEIDPADYPALMKELEVIGNA